MPFNKKSLNISHNCFTIWNWTACFVLDLVIHRKPSEVPSEGQLSREEILRFLGFICFASENVLTIGEMCWQFKLFVLPSLDPPGGPLPTKQVYFWVTFNKHPNTLGIAYYIRYGTDTATDTSRGGAWFGKILIVHNFLVTQM